MAREAADESIKYMVFDLQLYTLAPPWATSGGQYERFDLPTSDDFQFAFFLGLVTRVL